MLGHIWLRISLLTMRNANVDVHAVKILRMSLKPE